jgi:hypothetical protein
LSRVPSRLTASATVFGSWYWKGGGFITVPAQVNRKYRKLP